MKNQSMHTLLVAGTLLIVCYVLAMASNVTFPKCSDNSKDCCQFGLDMMRHRGYTLISYENSAMSVTCSHGVLGCALGNPNTMASYDGSKNVSCPDFKAMMEARSEISYIEGVKINKPKEVDDEEAAGTVKAAEVAA